MRIVSHTLVRNGMPFIVPVIEQVIPFMDECMITFSRYNTDKTKPYLYKLEKKYPDKIRLFQEQHTECGYLTIERQKLLGRTKSDWVLFLDADDWWSTESLQGMMELLDAGDDTDAWCFNPYQILDKEHCDRSWGNRWFSKLFKNQPGVHYEEVYPRDNIYKYDELLWWKTNPRVKKSNLKFFHLANLMKWRFRDQRANNKFQTTVGRTYYFKENVKPEIERIFSYL